jgi:hypothetical protein
LINVLVLISAFCVEVACCDLLHPATKTLANNAQTVNFVNIFRIIKVLLPMGISKRVTV